MIKITYLQTAQEVLQAFNDVRSMGDEFPYVGRIAYIRVEGDNTLTLVFNDDSVQHEPIEISPGVTYEDLCKAMADKLDIGISFSPKGTW